MSKPTPGTVGVPHASELFLLRVLSFLSIAHILFSMVFVLGAMALEHRFTIADTLLQNWESTEWNLLGMRATTFGAFILLLLCLRSRRYQGLGPGIICYTLRAAIRLIISLGVIGISSSLLITAAASDEIRFLSNLTAIGFLVATIRCAGSILDGYQREQKKLRRYLLQLSIGESSALTKEREFNRLGIFHQRGERAFLKFFVGR